MLALRSVITLVSAGAFVLAIACVRDGAQAGASDASSAATSSHVSSSKITPSPFDADAGFCGCKLCAPVIGPDACEKDDDCVPATGCHAHSCVARANAKPADPKLACTRLMDCQSADANRCGCVDTHCALGVVR